eukprot:gb/GEZN01013942.1/.p1 GENE.gb/GEZN01013942.1/~~gb/GEZN01013942.1/.p1  ORF type:complete len:197 (+),score=14.23 gb/GEZN01013942.1/:225-815(+)
MFFRTLRLLETKAPTPLPGTCRMRPKMPFFGRVNPYDESLAVSGQILQDHFFPLNKGKSYSRQELWQTVRVSEHKEHFKSMMHLKDILLRLRRQEVLMCTQNPLRFKMKKANPKQKKISFVWKNKKGRKVKPNLKKRTASLARRERIAEADKENVYARNYRGVGKGAYIKVVKLRYTQSVARLEKQKKEAAKKASA